MVQVSSRKNTHTINQLSHRMALQRHLYQLIPFEGKQLRSISKAGLEVYVTVCGLI